MTDSPDLQCRAFCLPRRGEAPADCEDAFAIDLALGRFAVADGATESAAAGVWARLLVQEYIAGVNPHWPDWLAIVQKRWLKAIERPPDAGPLPWFLAARYAEGAFSTFLGVHRAGGSWHILAVGDTCLFLVRDDTLELSYPLERAEQFGNTPWLIGSRSAPDKLPLHRGEQLQTECHPEDRLWLMTDALARWFLTEVEAGKQPWRTLRTLVEQPDASFASWLEELRRTRSIRNDDTTLVAVWAKPEPEEP